MSTIPDFTRSLRQESSSTTPSTPSGAAAAAKANPTPQINSIENAQLADFSSMEGGESFPAEFASSVSKGTFAAEYGLNVDLAKPVGSAGNTWLIPGKGELCL